MPIINRLAHALGRRDDVPNQELAKELAETQDVDEIREIVENLQNKDRNIQSDCIKVLYEIGYIAPELIAEYMDVFLKLLRSRNNRLVWGSMIALSTIAEKRALDLSAHIDEIKRAVEKGSVITVDGGIKTLAIIAAKVPDHRQTLSHDLLAHLATCRPKDVPQRAERILIAVNAENKTAFIETIERRMPDMKPTQVKRLRKVLREAEKRR